MKLSKTVKRLQQGVLSKGVIIKLNTRQFYAAEKNRMITMYSLTIPTCHRTKKGWKDVDYEIISTCSMVELVKCMADILHEAGDEKWRRSP